MSGNNPRTQWMINMIANCFKIEESAITYDQEVIQKITNFLGGKLGQVLLIYYQNTYKLNERNEKEDTSSTPTIIINEGKSIELKNKAAFFGRTIPEGAEFKNSQLQIASDQDLYFAEITNESTLSMARVINNYLSQSINQIEKGDWGEMENEQIVEFKKILKSFSKDINETVESYIKGVNFIKVPEEIKHYINNKQEYMSDESTQDIQSKIEEIFQSWINTLSNEIDFEKDTASDCDDVGPKYELEKWKNTMQRLTKVNDFFKSKDYRLLTKHFMEMKSKASPKALSLYNEMKQKKIDAHTAQSSAKDNMRYLSTLEIYFEPLYSGNPKIIIDSLQSLMNSLKLISFTARYYDNTKMTGLFSRITDQMILSCKDYILNIQENINNNDDYLWSKDPDDLISKFKDCIKLYSVYKEKYKEAKANATSTNKENNFDFGENLLFGRFDQFCKRLLKLIDLFTTIKQFEDIKRYKLDSMEMVERSYDEQLQKFKDKTSRLLDFNNSKFEKEYVQFNLSVSEIENELHKIINEEFKNLNSIEKKLKLLTKYEKILTKPNLQQNLKSEKIEIYSNYKREIDNIQNIFESGRSSPKLQRNMPKIAGRIKWAKHLFNRIYPYINNFKDISIKERSETELSFMTTNTLLYSYIILNEKFFEQFVETAKNKLNAPLLIVSETQGPRVNLDLYVLQLIRETKCMLRMNCNIPEAAKIILLQEDKFKKYYNELNFFIKEYNRILAPIIGTEAQNYFKSHIMDLNLKIQPLKTTVNWSSMNIETNLIGVFSTLQKLEYAISQFQDILKNRVHRNMNAIKTIDLLYVPEDSRSITIPQLLKRQEEYVDEKNKIIISKNSEIETSILDIISNIKEYRLDPKIPLIDQKQLSKLLVDYEDKLYEILMITTTNSMNNLRDIFNGTLSSPPLFTVEVCFSHDEIEISPKMSVIHDAVNSMAKTILSGLKDINEWKKLDKSESSSLYNKIGKDGEILMKRVYLIGAVKTIETKIKEYLDNTFLGFKALWTENIEKKIKDFNQKKEKNYSDYEEKLNIYSGLEVKIGKIPDEYYIGSIVLDMKTIKGLLLKYCNDWKTEYLKELLRKTRLSGKELNELITSFQQRLKKKPEKIEELKEMVETIEEIRQQEGNIEIQIKPYIQYYNLVSSSLKDPADFDKYNFPAKDSFDNKWKQILTQAAVHRDDLQKNQLDFRRKLFSDVNQLKEDVRILQKDYLEGGIAGLGSPAESYEKIEKFRMRVNILNKNKANIRSGEKLFNLSITEFPELESINGNLSKFEKLYNLYMDVLRQEDSWKEMPWNEAVSKLDEMEKKMNDFQIECNRVDKKFFEALSSKNNELNNLQELISKLTNSIESFRFLSNDFIEDIHWADVSELLKIKEIATAKSDGGIFKCKILFDARIDEFRNQLEDIESTARAQNKIKGQLDTVDETLRTKEFEFVAHATRQNIMLLNSLHFIKIKQDLEDKGAMIAGMKAQASKLTKDILARIKLKETQFQTIINNMELWIGVQSLWASLQSFFIGGDIRKDLPGPTKQFEGADKEWAKLMDKASGTKSVVVLCSGNELTPLLTDIDNILKICQKNLDNYLENKRGAFPRFYFVSNSVLLDILSKKNDPASIKTNLNIIFDALNDIDFSDFDKKYIIKIRQIKSESQPEHVQEVDMKAHPVKCDIKIEDWLNDLVKNMQLSIRDLFEKSYFDVKFYFDQSLTATLDQFEEYLKKYICQVVLFGLQVLGTKKLEEFVIRIQERGETYKKKLLGVDKGNNELDSVDQDFTAIQRCLTMLCSKGNKNKLEIVKYETLIIIQVHNRDIFNFILTYKDGPITVNDYDWLKQTRVYWYSSPSYKTCIINITDVPFEYGYEFLGAKERMCITELTDKCYITLAQALGMNYGGAPAGPAGTGKTETVKDMARSMGLFVLVTNCSPEHRYKDMAQIFKGLCKSGAWGCFDEFNRIDLEVLSVVATIVSTIQDAKKAGMSTFVFPDTSNPNDQKDSKDKMCELIETTAYFITMNPGYSGRNELPENLKVLFRGVTMMVADKQAIIRVKLSSYGFMHDEDLSKKFAKLYALCEEQLSKQKHYDFGLRNILSVLRHAGNEKKKVPDESKEEELMYVALRDMNLSKFVPDDIQLFKSLINDVFPSQRDAKEKEYASLEATLKKILVDRKLDTRKEWVKKIIQTYETSVVRHGFMIVGVTGTGKTTIMEVLTQAMEKEDPDKNKWKIHRMNPKALEQNYLYIEKKGDIFVLGTFTMLWKRCNDAGSNDSSYNNWLVCDGPIDAIWIENLNTVLDDNKILTLSNNDRINMLEGCRLVFETENLKNASLATVSRCGMIYITEQDISYSPYINSWIQKNRDNFKDQKDQKIQEIRDFIEKKYLSDSLIAELTKKEYNLVMPTSWLIRIKNFLLLIQAILFNPNDKDKKTYEKSYLEKVIVFSLIWGVGGLFESDQRKIFHQYLRSIKAPIPEIDTDENTIYEYRIEGNDWVFWKTEEYDIKKELDNFSNLLVPTMDSTRAIYLIETIARIHLENSDDRRNPSLLIGDAGTAKTSAVLLYRKLRFKEDQVLKRINFSSATNPTTFQATMDDELDKAGANEFVPLNEKNMIVFIDDISMPYVNKFGDQMTLELARQLLEFGGYYLNGDNDNRGIMKKVKKISFVGAMNHPKGGKNDIPNRLKRQFFIFNLVMPNDQSVRDIYGKIIDLYFPSKSNVSAYDQVALSKSAQKLTILTTNLLKKVKAKFQPTPIKFHYNFNMREISRTFQGVFGIRDYLAKLRSDPKEAKQVRYPVENMILILWKHEATRVFCDKLRDILDKTEFNQILDGVINDNLGDSSQVVEILKEELLFCDYLRDIYMDESLGREVFPKVVELIPDMERVRVQTSKFMESLKLDKKRKAVNIVLFDDCLKYLIRITRIIQTDQGSAMVVGVGGSGKQSLTRLAAYVSQHDLIQLSADKSDKLEELKTEFRNIFNNVTTLYNPQVGKYPKHTFLMTDAELKLDSFLETVSSFLATGEIANLFAKKEEKQSINASTRAMMGKMPQWANKAITDDIVMIELINSVRKYVHVVLCFSPSSDKFREKYIKFPVLFSTTTIIWLLPWPEEALISVVEGFFNKDMQRLKLVANDEQKRSLFNHIGSVHVNITKMCETYYEKMRRYVYVTPKSYLSFIEEYIKLYCIKREEVVLKESTINAGLKKLAQAEEDIKTKSQELEIEMVYVEEAKRKVDEKEKQLSIESANVAVIEEEVNANEKECLINKEKIQKDEIIVNEQFKAKKPELEMAILKCKLDKKDVQGISGKTIPSGIKFYWEATMLVMGKRLSAIQDVQAIQANKGTTIDYFSPDSWDLCQHYLGVSGDTNFFTTLQKWQKLIQSKKLNINDETLELLRPLLETKTKEKQQLVFEESYASSASTEAIKLVDFCTSINLYVKAVREILPMQQLLELKGLELKEAEEKLDVQRKKKAEVIEKKNELEKELRKVKKEKDEKEAKAKEMRDIVENATNLISNLSNEKTKWKQDSLMFDMEKRQLLGDCAVASGFIAYAGPFNFEFRNVIVKEVFKNDIISRGIPLTQTIDLEEFLIDETTKGEWAYNKLPSDTLSIQNGILVYYSSRYPLLIDPQNQAKTWLVTSYPEILNNKNAYQQKELMDKFDLRFQPLLENGDRIIIEGIENEVDTKLDPVLEKNLIGSGKVKKLKIGDKDIDFNENFKMYLLCKLINPHFTPELAAKTTIIDFNVTIVGLEQQLQGIVVYKEQQSLEDTLKSIISEITRNKKSLLECQKAILDNLNNSDDLLANTQILKVLTESKSKSIENTNKVKDAEEKKKDINHQREKYLPVAIRGAVLYFSIVNMQEISKMYSTSLQQFQELFFYSIDNAIPSKHKETRVKNIVQKLTEHVYKYVVRGLFECNKVTFIMIVCFKILTTEKSESGYPLLNNADIGAFIKAGAGIIPSKVEDCNIQCLVSKSETKPKEWLNLIALNQHKFNGSMNVFSKILDKIRDNQEKFKSFYTVTDCENFIPFDDIYNQSNQKLVSFLKLMFIRSLRNDRTIIYATKHFVSSILEDKDFLKSYGETIDYYYTISSARIPILYLLSAGADPSSGIEELRKRKKKQMYTISMGENQDATARSFVEKARETGDWVLLQNCHLGLSFMAELDGILKNQDLEFNEGMRIWLSCEPRNEFPIGLLHQSLKITNEPPKGIQASMIKTYSSVINQDMIDKYEFKEWRNLVFTLSFLHSLVLERRKYGPLGWCIKYDFNNSDLESSILFIDKQFQKELEIDDKKPPQEMINFKTLVNVVSTILYGGRITDRKDGELFKTIMGSYLEKNLLLKMQTYVFYPQTNSKGGDKNKVDKDLCYRMPDESINQIQAYIEHIKTFPDVDPPGVFGLHGSADLTFRLKEFNELLETIQVTLPTDGGSSGGVSKEDDVKMKVKDFLSTLPPDFIEREYRGKIEKMSWGSLGTGLNVPLHNVLLQEIIRIQGIIDLVKQSLVDIREALHGRLMMTEEIVKGINSLFDAKPPQVWMYNANDEEISWLSPSVTAWYDGLNLRASKLKEWLDSPIGQRPPFWLPGFLNPQGFVAAFKQEVFKIKKASYTGQQEITLDRIGLKFDPDKNEIDPKIYVANDKKKDNKDRFVTMIVYGLNLEGAIWNGALQDDPDVNSRTPIIKFPVIRVEGIVEEQKAAVSMTQNQYYKCPLYKYPRRTDKYYIIEIGLKISGEQDEKYWQKRGVALLCNQD